MRPWWGQVDGSAAPVGPASEASSSYCLKQSRCACGNAGRVLVDGVLLHGGVVHGRVGTPGGRLGQLRLVVLLEHEGVRHGVGRRRGRMAADAARLALSTEQPMV